MNLLFIPKWLRFIFVRSSAFRRFWLHTVHVKTSLVKHKKNQQNIFFFYNFFFNFCSMNKLDIFGFHTSICLILDQHIYQLQNRHPHMIFFSTNEQLQSIVFSTAWFQHTSILWTVWTEIGYGHFSAKTGHALKYKVLDLLQNKWMAIAYSRSSAFKHT